MKLKYTIVLFVILLMPCVFADNTIFGRNSIFDAAGSLYEEPECNDGYDNDNDGFVDMDDHGCSSSSDDYEDNACGDYWDNDNDNYRDYYGGCDTDKDGWTDYFCGCDTNGDNFLSRSANNINEFNIKHENCLGTFGCINPLKVNTADQEFSSGNYCQNGYMYLPDPECYAHSDDNERDAGMQWGKIGGLAETETELGPIGYFTFIQGAFLAAPPGVNFFLYFI